MIMRLYILFCVLFSAVLFSPLADAGQVKFGPLCSGNPSNSKRGCDKKYGCGKYGASRPKVKCLDMPCLNVQCTIRFDSYCGGEDFQDNGKRKHMGLDIVCADGATVYAPFDVKLNGKAAPYKKDNAINDGISLSGEGLCFKLFYIKPDRYSGTLKKGQKIGTLLPMQKVYPGITSHVHVQMCDKSDPTKYF
ncbi:leukocyte cell-derived chemotaxin-2-like isoform X1 [Myxocyprinus asiaticus]|uniref:leukocyte cell-derived chemotaxin-2-like isoform X1 n=1 Tax=Myxocyprinus asiaticus TaxID=70543 RepID=UPI00222218CF|nr:leukocyte cell-derived chemotaxin-2-like isoform X1 [Myxocyprinus asiaticus]